MLPLDDRLVPDLDHTVLPASSPNVTFDNNSTSSAITSLLAYKDYDPCQFSLVDLENPGYTNGNEVISGVFEISDKEMEEEESYGVYRTLRLWASSSARKA